MKNLDLKQGSKEWEEARFTGTVAGVRRFTASEAGVMMGRSKFCSRDKLLQMKATGYEQEYSSFVKERIFNAGHEAEAKARPLVEEMIGDELFPVVGVHDDYDWMLASFDGLTLFNEINFEHKQWSEKLAAAVRDGSVVDDPAYYWQWEQQMFVSGAEKTVFVVSDGTKKNFEHIEYKPARGRAKSLLKGWEQFKKDLDAYEPSEATVEVVGSNIETLPSIAVDVSGDMAVESNLGEFETKAIAFIGGINSDLKTDRDFADADIAVKFCKASEDNIEVVKAQVLSKVQSIDTVIRTLDRIKAEMRTKRLALNSQVTAQKQLVRDNIRLVALTTISEYYDEVNNRLGRVLVLMVPADIAGVMRGKKTVDSLTSAANDEVARVKLEVNEIAEVIEANLATLDKHAAEHMFLFQDLQEIAVKETDYFGLLVTSRINEYEAAEKKRKDDEREKIRLEEEAAAQKRLDDAETERKRLEEEEKAKTPPEDETPTDEPQEEPVQAKQADKVSTLAFPPSSRAHEKIEPIRGAPASELASLLGEVARWCDAWKIPQDAGSELSDIITEHLQEKI